MRQFVGGNFYTTRLWFQTFFPCSNETLEDTGNTLRRFVEFVGIPPTLHSDNNKNFKRIIFKWLLKFFEIISTYSTEPNLYWQNRYKPVIGEVKWHTRKLMLELNNPIRFWCFCYEYTADIIYLCGRGCFELWGWTPYETVMNYTPYINEYASFPWLQWSWFFDESLKSEQLRKWLGPACGVAQKFFSYILTDNGGFINRSSVIQIDEHELTTDHMNKQRNNLIEHVEAKLEILNNLCLIVRRHT